MQRRMSNGPKHGALCVLHASHLPAPSAPLPIPPSRALPAGSASSAADNTKAKSENGVSNRGKMFLSISEHAGIVIQVALCFVRVCCVALTRLSSQLACFIVSVMIRSICAVSAAAADFAASDRGES